MKPWLPFGLFSAAALCTLVSPVRGDVLDKSRVPAQARWVAHVDVEALTRSTLFTALKSQHGSELELDGDLAELKSEFGIDPFVDLKSLTVYCAEKDPERSVILMSGSEKLDAALARLQEQPGYRTEKDGAHTLHVWSTGDESWYGWVLRRDASANRVVVLSANRDDVLNGVAVVEGAKPSLTAQRDGIAFASPAPGSILFAAANENLTELDEIEATSRVFKLAQTMSIDVGEDRGALYAHAVVDTKTPQDALKIQQVLQGAVALLGLMSDEPGIGEHVSSLVGALRFETNGSRVTADFRYDVKALLEIFAELEKHAEHDGDDDEDDEDR
jgi:hypothetical protein